MTLALVGELLLCRHLELIREEQGERPTACAVAARLRMIPCRGAEFFIIVSLLTFCRGSHDTSQRV